MDTSHQPPATTSQPLFNLKRCPRCEETLPLSEFGVCNARPDKKNLYCRLCIRQKIALYRQSLREYNASRRKAGLTPRHDVQEVKSITHRSLKRRLRGLAPADKVREAIRCGAKTQKEIIHATKLPVDGVTDCIASLLLWTRDVRTEVIDGVRMYFVNEPGQVIRRKPVRPASEPKSHGVSTIYSRGGYAV